MDPNEEGELSVKQDFEGSPREGDFSKMSQAEREANFRRQRQEYIAQKMKRKKEQMQLKRNQFGESSSDDSDEDGPGSRSSKSSVRRSQPRQTPKLSTLETPKKQIVQTKPQVEGSTPRKKLSETLDRVAVLVPTKRGNEWSKDILVIGEKSIIIQSVTEEFKNFTKVKIIADSVLGCPYKIKINYSQNQQVLFAISAEQQKIGLPIHYYVFAKLIQERLIASGIKLKQKIQKMTGLPESLIKGSIIYGNISKKSQILGNWEQRFVLINKTGIYSYKKPTQKPSMSIPMGSINQLWTRLQTQQNLLVVKIWYSGKKTEFGFPLVDMLNVNNWMYGFYMMLGKAK